MRVMFATAAIALLASSGSAFAADCTKGLLWPYVRNPGDCLTDTEIQAGKTGVYSGPVTGQVDVSTINPPPQAKAGEPSAVQCSHSWYWPFGSGDCQPAPSAAGASAVTAASPAANNPSTAEPAAQPAAPALPAVKPQAAAAPATPAAQPVQATLVSVKAEAAVAPPPALPIRLAQANAAECHKGVLWPFIRDAGDCPTTADKGSGNTTAVPVANAPSPIPAAVTNAPAPAPPPVKTDAALVAPASATCTKSVLWPFIRESGDCATTADKGSGKTATVPVSATPPPATPIAPTTAAAAAPAANISGASCTRSWLWPFVREAGDCATTTERGNGVTSAVPIRTGATVEAPALVPAAATMPQPPVPQDNSAPAANQPTACHKGLFWPFVREAGDCPTDADKTPQRNPS